MIIKIQRPLGSNMDNPPALVYSEDRSLETHIPLVALQHLFDQTGEPVLYYEATISKGRLAIGKRVAAQSW